MSWVLPVLSDILSRFETRRLLFTQHGAPVYDRIEIISGICLFNGDLFLASLSEPHGGRVDPIAFQTGPTLQEVEHIARSSGAIADLAALFISRVQERRSNVLVTITLDIPSFHYYHSVVEKFRTGLWSTKTALEWMDAVDLRHDQIAMVYTGMVKQELERRGILGNYEVRTSSTSSPVARLSREALRLGKCPRLDEAFKSLDEDKDGLWRYFYRHVPAKDRPLKWEDLGYLFYVFEVGKSALVERVAPGTRNGGVPHSVHISAWRQHGSETAPFSRECRRCCRAPNLFQGTGYIEEDQVVCIGSH